MTASTEVTVEPSENCTDFEAVVGCLASEDPFPEEGNDDDDVDCNRITPDLLLEIGLNEKWRYNCNMEKFLRCIPKVELHVHFDGSFDVNILHSHLTKSGDYQCLPENVTSPWDNASRPIRQIVSECQDINDFTNLCTCRGKRSLYEMFKCFEVFVPIVQGNITLLEQLAHDFVRGQAQQNVIYTEVRYCPHLLALGGAYGATDQIIDANPIVDAITRGLRHGESEYGVKVNQILCCLSWRPDLAEDIVRLAHERKDSTPCAVVGIDLAAGEEHFDEESYPHLHEPHRRAFNKARELNLNVTIHAGEVGEPEYIKRAVDLYGAKRIGHGYRIVYNKRLMDEMRQRNIHFEVCPTSSVETGGWMYDPELGKDWKTHPVALMTRHGMNVGFNSDDPSVFNTSLTWQLRIAMGKMRLSRNSILRSYYNSVDAAFIKDEEKYELRQIMNKFLTGFENGANSQDSNFIERVASVPLIKQLSDHSLS